MTRVTATMTIEREVTIGCNIIEGEMFNIGIVAYDAAECIDLTEAEETRSRELLLAAHRDNQQAAIERRGDERRDEE